MVIADRRLAPSEKLDYKAFTSIANNVDVPSLVQVQVNSFEWLKTDGLKDLLEEISPIEDFSGGQFDLRFLSHEIRDPKHTYENRTWTSETICARKPTCLKCQPNKKTPKWPNLRFAGGGGGGGFCSAHKTSSISLSTCQVKAFPL